MEVGRLKLGRGEWLGRERVRVLSFRCVEFMVEVRKTLEETRGVEGTNLGGFVSEG